MEVSLKAFDHNSYVPEQAFLGVPKESQRTQRFSFLARFNI
jgi:hypothetical protein